MTQNHNHDKHTPSCHKRDRFDWLLWGSVTGVAGFYLAWLLLESFITDIPVFSGIATSVFDLINQMWWSLLLAIFTVGLLGRIPQELVMKVLGRGGTFSGLIRATAGGVLLDLCSHGILMVGMRLYDRGASIGQVVAFLMASPWNSFSLTLILIALVGLPWTLAFIGLSMTIGIISGFIFDRLANAGTLPNNPNIFEVDPDFSFWKESKKLLSGFRPDPGFFIKMMKDGLSEGRMVLRWILFGVLLASVLRGFMSPDAFSTWFGPTMAGLGLTVIAATILEVCSEGSAPIAADLLTRAGAPGNSFAFLMTGVSTDYTEIMSLKDTTKSWKIALFLPLISVPQVLLIAWLINQGTT